MTERPREIDDFPVVIRLPVLWGHMDAFGHVNNIRFFRYMESARVAYMDRLELMKIRQETGIGPILAEVGCKFIRPLTYPDDILIGCRTTHLSHVELTEETAIFSENQKRIVAVGKGKIVAYDYGKLQPTSFPPKVIRGILELEKNVVYES